MSPGPRMRDALACDEDNTLWGARPHDDDDDDDDDAAPPLTPEEERGRE